MIIFKIIKQIITIHIPCIVCCVSKYVTVNSLVLRDFTCSLHIQYI